MAVKDWRRDEWRRVLNDLRTDQHDGRPVVGYNDPLLAALIREHGSHGRPDYWYERQEIRDGAKFS